MFKSNVNLKGSFFIGLLACSIVSPSFAGQGQTRLSSTLNLEPACIINSKTVVNGVSNQKIGELDFGDQSSGFSSVNTMLTNEFNAIKIYCPMNSRVNVSFNAGRNAANVPTVNQSKADRAMSNGNGYFIAYQIYRDNKSGTVLTPQTQLNFDGGAEHQIRVYAEAYNAGRIVQGQYTDQITVTIAF